MATGPLLLAEVLEQETVRLRGAPKTTLRRRWTVQASEIREARELARRLASKLERTDDSAIHDWMKRGHEPGYAAAIAPQIDTLLAAKQWLFDRPRFGDLDHPPFVELKRRPYDQLGDVEDYASADEVYNLNRRMFDDLFHDEVTSAAESRLGEAVASIHEGFESAPRTGLAISGGGIRSATFALGVLQGLSRRRLLQDFDFVSTVSGGGYIGSWLSSWSRRDPWGIRGVAGMLASRPARRLDPEPVPIRHLRAFSNYLTPKLGGLSADTWALIATYLRNLIINWLVLVPLLAAVVLLPRLLASGLRNPPYDPTVAAIAACGAGALLLVLALRNLIVARPISDWNRRKSFDDGKFLFQCLLPVLLASVLLVLTWAWYARGGGTLRLWFVVACTTALCVIAFFVFWREMRSGKSVEHKADEREPHRKLFRVIGEAAASLVAGVGGGALAWLAATELFFEPTRRLSVAEAVRWPLDDPSLHAATAVFVIFGIPVLLGILFLQATLFVGIAGKTNHDFDREWWARASGWVLITAVAWVVLAAVAIYGPVGIYYLPGAITALGGVAGLFSLVAGWSSKTKGSPASDGKESGGIVGKLLGLAVPLFIAFLLAALSLGITALLGVWTTPGTLTAEAAARQARLGGLATDEHEHPEKIVDRQAQVEQKLVADVPRWRSYEHFRVLYGADPNYVLVLFFGSLILAVGASAVIGVNVFSMHALYRNRLVRAYLGASRWSRDPNAFTGFDPRDNLSMHELRPEYLWYYSFRDVPALAKRLAEQSTEPLKTLSKVWGEKLGDIAGRVLEAAEKGKVDPAFYIAANGVIATADLLPADPPEEVLRPLRNRRFVELAFDDEIYPSPMPTLCVQDLRDPDSFPDVFAKSAAAPLHAKFRRKKPLTGKGRLDLSELLDELNEVISTADLRADAAFAKLEVDASAFAVDAKAVANVFGPGARVVHRMIDNRLRLEKAIPGALAPLRPAKGFHLVDICLNLTGGEQLAWQERKGESFTASPLVAGNYRLGYRDSRDYGQISLGTAVTISGAAASPNMGYHSSPALAFLLTLFNVRLGWWLGNPGLAGQKTYRRRNPSSSLLPLVAEATGNTNDDFGYVYLSDGGHFENLGLYELVLRRCHQIVVSDAGADPEYAYDDLGNAVRKIRVDLGIPIRITRIGIIPPDEKTPGKYCAVGEIDYAAVDGKDDDGKDRPCGKFLYVKPVVYQGDEDLPRDVLNYDRQSPEFPHESTGDQWFSESQFESYRRLGEFAIDQMCAHGIKACAVGGQPATIASIEELIDVAGQGLEPIPEWAEAPAALPPVVVESMATGDDQSAAPPTTAD